MTVSSSYCDVKNKIKLFMLILSVEMVILLVLLFKVLLLGNGEYYILNCIRYSLLSFLKIFNSFQRWTQLPF